MTPARTPFPVKEFLVAMVCPRWLHCSMSVNAASPPPSLPCLIVLIEHSSSELGQQLCCGTEVSTHQLKPNGLSDTILSSYGPLRHTLSESNGSLKSRVSPSNLTTPQWTIAEVFLRLPFLPSLWVKSHCCQLSFPRVWTLSGN